MMSSSPFSGTLQRLAIPDALPLKPGPAVPRAGEVRRYFQAALVGALPCLAASAFYFGPRVFAAAAVAVAVGAAVEVVFAGIRRKPVTGGSLVICLLLALCLPPGLPLWMVAVGAAVGVLFGKEVFGGPAHYVFSPVLVGKGFLMFSFPQVLAGSPHFGSMMGIPNVDAWVVGALLTLLGAVVLLVANPSGLGTIAGVLFAAACVGQGMVALGLMPYGTVLELLVTDGFLFGAVFLAVDPSCSPTDRLAKWLYGMLIGALAVSMRCFSNYSEAMLSAILVANLFAPTIDLLATRRADREE